MQIKELLSQALIGLYTPREIEGSIKFINKFYIIIDGEISPFANLTLEKINCYFKQIQIIKKEKLQEFLIKNPLSITSYEE